MSSAAMYGLATWFVVLGLGQVVAGYQPLGQITVGLGVVTACANFWIDHWRRF